MLQKRHVLSYRKFILVSFIFLFGCGPTKLTPQLPTSTVVIHLSPTKTVLLSTPPSTPTPVCPDIDPKVEYTPPRSNDEIADNILAFINNGGDLDKINSYFVQFPKTLDILATDLNDDGFNEIIIAGALPLEMQAAGDGVIYVLSCTQKSYQIAKQFDLHNIFSARVIRTEKLLADYPKQSIIEYFPVSGWASDIVVIGFMNGEWKVLLHASEFSPKLVVFDQDNDDNKEISLHSFTTATQGPQRIRITTFKWNGQNYSPVSNQLMPGTTRVEYLDDAQNALHQGDISMAIAHYDRAAHDVSLGNFASRGELQQNQTDWADDYQISFALFRLSILWFTVGDTNNGLSILQELEDQFPINKPGSEFTQAIRIFYDEVIKGRTSKEACNAVTLFFTENYPDINTHIGDWGVSVTDYTAPLELCFHH